MVSLNSHSSLINPTLKKHFGVLRSGYKGLLEAQLKMILRMPLVCLLCFTIGLGLARDCTYDDVLQSILPTTNQPTFSLGDCTDLCLTAAGGEGLGLLGSESLALALAGNRKLETLRVGRNRLGDAGIRSLAMAIPHATSLHTLYLNRNDFSAEAGRILGRLLAKETNLKEIYMAENPGLSGEGILALAEGLANNYGLEVLFLSSSGFTSGDVSSIARVLHSHKTIHTVYLRQRCGRWRRDRSRISTAV